MLTHKLNTLISVGAFLVLLALSFFIPVKWWWFTVIFLVWFTITSIGSFTIMMNYHLKAHVKSNTVTEKIIALTFDDGPHPATEAVLDLLRKYDAKCTFFCIGREIERYPDIFKRILAEGHIIGNHSFNHLANTGFLSQAQMTEEILSTDVLVEKVSGKKLRYYRPPFGVTNPSIRKALAFTGHTVIGWNVRSLDTVIKQEETILKRIKKRLSPGSIVLMHDTSLKTVHVLEQLLMFLHENQYRAVTVEQLLNIPAYEK